MRPECLFAWLLNIPSGFKLEQNWKQVDIVPGTVITNIMLITYFLIFINKYLQIKLFEK